MTRRDSLFNIFGLGASIERPKFKNRRTKHKNIIIYSGTIELPEEVIKTALQSSLYRTTHRHEVVRFKLHGYTFIFRELVEGNNYRGEIVQGENGNKRIHLWRVMSPGTIAKFKFNFNTLGKIGENDKIKAPLL